MGVLGIADEGTGEGEFCKLYVFGVGQNKDFERAGTQNLDRKEAPFTESMLCILPWHLTESRYQPHLLILAHSASLPQDTPDFPGEVGSSLHVLIAQSVWLHCICVTV